MQPARRKWQRQWDMSQWDLGAVIASPYCICTELWPVMLAALMRHLYGLFTVCWAAQAGVTGLCALQCLRCGAGCLQAFARLSAVYGGTYMLHKSDAQVVYDESGRAVGVSSEGETAKCKFVVGDPSYFSDKTRPTSRVVRAICILSHPIPNTDNAHSVQIILPQKQIGRHSGGCTCRGLCASASGNGNMDHRGCLLSSSFITHLPAQWHLLNCGQT